MKRKGNLYQDICSIENIKLADEIARRGKAAQYGVKLHDRNRDAITIASSDGAWMVFSYKLPLTSKVSDDVLITPRVITVLQGQETMKFNWNEKIYAFDSEILTVVVTRPEYEYPEFRKILPEGFDSNLTLNRADLMQALRKCGISSDPFKNTTAKLDKKNVVRLIAADPKIDIQADIVGDYAGKVDDITFSSDKMLTILHQIPVADIELAIHEKNRGMLFRAPEDPAYLGFLMPIFNKE